MSKKPNVILLFSDQQRYDTINAAGHKHMFTPNLDKLIKDGIYYPNAHSSNPVCMPARHDLITGLSAKYHGYYTNSENTSIKDYAIPTLPRVFSENGYRTAAIGKMHFYPVREHHGFGEMRLMEELPKIRQNDQYATFLSDEGLGDIQNIHGIRPHLYHTPQISMQDLSHHGTTWVADETIRWLEENGEEPFFVMSAFIQPHPPWNIPKELDNLYLDEELPLPIENSRLPHDEEISVWFGDNDTDEHIRFMRKAYYTSVSMVDMAIGKIMDYLDKHNKLENTIVIFNSDHGEMLKDKGYYSKELPYESSVKVPLIIRLPNAHLGGTIDEDFTDTFDIFPICLDLCGLNYNGKYNLLGESLFSKNKKNRDIQISATGLNEMRWVMCRNQNYKYIYHYNGGYEELYDIHNDPKELENLILSDSLANYKNQVWDELKNFAIESEEKNAPEGYIENNTFKQYDFTKLNPSIRGKFHFWQNHQMQVFFRDNDRAKKLLQEMILATDSVENRGMNIRHIFNESDWVKDFKSELKKYEPVLSESEIESIINEIFTK